VSIEVSSARSRPTRRDVAALANVSGTTVSRVLSGREDQSISDQARARVLKAARELGYSPNSAAKALRSGRSGLIGFWMCLEYSLYRSMVLAHMRSLVADSEFALAVTDVDEDYHWHRSLDRSLRMPVEGIIAFDASTATYYFAEQGDRLAPNVPFVSMGAFWTEARSFVGVDLRVGAIEAVRHLVAMGRRRIAYVAPLGTSFVDSGSRYEGYRDTMKEAGLEPRVIAVDDYPPRRVAAMTAMLAENLREGTLPDAILFFYDDMATDAIYAMESLGLKPGVDIALVGFNGTIGIDRGPYALTTVRQPVEKMCELALEFLRAQIEDPTAPVQGVVLEPELIVRASSGYAEGV